MANIDLITGFLGAGKTTFIRKYCEYLRSKGESFAVIENEYGNKGIDSRILALDGISSDELYGGCICCTLKVGFRDMLLRLSEKYDRIIVEPSGVYDISQFYAVMNSPAFAEKCSIGNVICVVDPFSLEQLDSFSIDMLKRQVTASGAVVFSMLGNADNGVYNGWLSKLKVLLDVNDISHVCYYDLECLYRIGGGYCHIDAEPTHSAKYLSTLVKPDPVPADIIKERISSVFESRDFGQILRIKGVWNSHIVNAIPNCIEIYEGGSDEGLNVIGLDIRRKGITDILNGVN